MISFPNFPSFFSFSQAEVDEAFKNARTVASISGLKLLQNHSLTPDHGKLLIITPRSSGKAHQRNLLRRRIKSIYFEHELYKKPIVSILIAYKQVHNLGFDELQFFLKKHLS